MGGRKLDAALTARAVAIHRGLPMSTNRRCDRFLSGEAYWVLSQLALCSPQKALFENAAAALEGQRGTRSTNRQRQAMEAMESKLKRKDEVLAIVVEEMVRLKKELGEN